MKTEEKKLSNSELNYIYALSYIRILKTNYSDIQGVESRLLQCKNEQDFAEAKKDFHNICSKVEEAFSGIDAIVWQLGDQPKDDYVKKIIDIVNGHMDNGKLVNGHYKKYKKYFKNEFAKIDALITSYTKGTRKV